MTIVKERRQNIISRGTFEALRLPWISPSVAFIFTFRSGLSERAKYTIFGKDIPSDAGNEGFCTPNPLAGNSWHVPNLGAGPITQIMAGEKNAIGSDRRFKKCFHPRTTYRHPHDKNPRITFHFPKI